MLVQYRDCRGTGTFCHHRQIRHADLHAVKVGHLISNKFVVRQILNGTQTPVRNLCLSLIHI